MSKNSISNMIHDLNKSNIKDLSNSAIIYARCSTPKQNQDMLQSLQTQIAICMEYAKANNLIIIETISEVARGHGKKQTYNSVLDKSNTNLIIADASRLSRNISDGNIFVTKCEKKNILIHSVRDDIITNSNQERKKLFNCIYDASIESSVISKRISSAFKIRRQLGSHFGNPPYGYKIFKHVDKKSGIKLRKLLEDSTEQTIIKFITKLYYGGNIKDIYNTFRKIKPTLDFKLTDLKNNEFEFVEYGNIIKKDIKILLDEYEITYRGEPWKTSDISKIINKNKHFL